MTFWKTCLGSACGSTIVLAFYACSVSSGSPTDNGVTGQQNGGGRGAASSTDASLGSGSANANANANAGGGGTILFGSSGGGNGRNSVGDACPAIRQKPEQITVLKDATVTDTIYNYKPVALFIMQDRSGSMVTGSPAPACSCSWDNATAAITAFVNDPRAVGIDIGMGEFPVGANNTASCSDGVDCGTAVVPIAPLPGNAAAMIQAYQVSQKPSNPIANTPTECALRGMINTCLQFTAQSPTSEQCVAVLVTDGVPTECDTDQQHLVQIVSDGHSNGVTTYTLGLPGADLNALNQLAQAGGTNGAIDISSGPGAMITALNNIRQAVGVTTTTQVTTTQVISTPLPCEWTIPSAPAGTTFDKNKVNVQFVTPSGAPVQFGYVASQSDCARATGDAWYYDDPNDPKKVLVCDSTCSGTLHNSAGAEVDILFGCDTQPAIFH